MRVREWPNKLGWDVAQHEVGLDREVGVARVRVYRGGELWKVSTPTIERMLLDTPTTPELLVNAVRLTKRFGTCAKIDCESEKHRKIRAQHETPVS